ncbi:MAG: hypothetical protein KAV87_30595 [Desulfobacteraceae bacterium]|nr:hypothetical protein [Desulfobacteraceae bacterium]
MALTKQITKIWPTLGNRNIFQCGIQLVLTDDSVEVVNESFMADYRKGADVDEITPDLIAKAQARIDRYKAEKQINGAATYDNAVTVVSDGIVL